MEQKTNKSSLACCSILSLVGSCALLAVILVPTGLAMGWLVARRFDALVLTTAATATGVCWLAGTLALSATVLGNRFRCPVQGLLVGILLRTGLPLVAGAALNQVAPLAETGIFSMILGVYLCALTAETILALRMIQPAPRTSPAAS